MADLVHINYFVLSILDRFGIKLGFGDKNIDQVCRDYEINPDFFLEIINAFIDNEYFPQKKLQNFSVELIVKYLSKTHDYYHQEKIPVIDSLMSEMIKNCYSNKENLSLLKKFFEEYKQELKNHTKREEDVVFPYSIAIEKKYLGESLIDTEEQLLKEYSMSIFLNEHTDIEEKLYDLKNIVIKYLPQPRNQKLCNALLYELFSLEKDMNDHNRIEEKVLVPKISAMEEILSSQKQD